LLRQAIPELTVVDLAQAEHVLADPTATGSVTEANWQFHRALYPPSAARSLRSWRCRRSNRPVQTHLDNAMRTVLDFLRLSGSAAQRA